MDKKIVLIDGYVDEPSCLGVPPYISPYIRYTYGALLDLGIKEEKIDYYLIDEVRKNMKEYVDKFKSTDLVIIIAGTTVPGKYMGGKPISLKEINNISKQISKDTKTLLGGPVLLTFKDTSTFTNIEVAGFLDETGALGIYEYLSGQKPENNKINYWAKLGSRITRKHPNYPALVCEIETYRGCIRPKSCSFCSEYLKKVLYTRPHDEIAKEVEALYNEGNKYFRIGAQTDLFMYGADYEDGILTPKPEIIHKLYSVIKEKAPNLLVLHMDNANPATIAGFPSKSEEIIKIITNYNTPGDTAAFGLESADPKVLKANNVGTSPEKTKEAIKIMNEAGGFREEGIPKLLPGLNFLHGLSNEDEETYELNFNFLKELLDEGYLLRRINIRQVIPVPGFEKNKVNEYKFNKYKEKINKEINKPMLERVFPTGVIMKNVLIESVEGNISFGRQLGTYPILIGVPGVHEVGRFIDVKIIDHGYRSITGLKFPFNINEASLEEFRALPGIGKKRASNLFVKKPFKDFEEVKNSLDESFNPKELERLKDCLDVF